MANQWFISNESGEHGPYSSAELKQRAEQGLVTPNLQVCRGKDGTADGRWVEASKVKGLFPDVAAPVAQPVPPAIPVGQPAPPPAASETSTPQSNPRVRSCSDCGNTVSKNAACCPSCGCPVQNAERPPSPSMVSLHQKTKPASASRLRVAVVTSTAILIAVAVFVFAYRLWTQHQLELRKEQVTANLESSELKLRQLLNMQPSNTTKLANNVKEIGEALNDIGLYANGYYDIPSHHGSAKARAYDAHVRHQIPELRNRYTALVASYYRDYQQSPYKSTPKSYKWELLDALDEIKSAVNWSLYGGYKTGHEITEELLQGLPESVQDAERLRETEEKRRRETARQDGTYYEQKSLRVEALTYLKARDKVQSVPGRSVVRVSRRYRANGHVFLFDVRYTEN